MANIGQSTDFPAVYIEVFKVSPIEKWRLGKKASQIAVSCVRVCVCVLLD